MTRHMSVLAAIVAAAIFVVSAAAAGAQATPATPDAAVGPTFAANIHEGSCGDIDEVPFEILFPLEDLSPLGIDVAQVHPAREGTATPEVAGTPVVEQAPAVNPVVAEGTTAITAPLEDLFATDTVIVVEGGDTDADAEVVCGALAGTPEAGTLIVTLQEQHASGYLGEAHLTDTGDGTTTVTIRLMQRGVDPAGTPAATPGV